MRWWMGLGCTIFGLELFGGSDADPTGDTAVVEARTDLSSWPEACADYVACAEGTSWADGLDAWLSTFGPDGVCLQQESPAFCASACDQSLRTIRSSCEAYAWKGCFDETPTTQTVFLDDIDNAPRLDRWRVHDVVAGDESCSALLGEPVSWSPTNSDVFSMGIGEGVALTCTLDIPDFTFACDRGDGGFDACMGQTARLSFLHDGATCTLDLWVVR